MTRRRRIAWGIAGGWLAVCVVGELVGSDPALALRTDGEAGAAVLCASLPQPLTYVARHCWLAIKGEGETSWERWDVWQNAGAHSAESWGHVHRGLQSPTAGVGGGAARVLAVTRGADAAAFAACVRRESPRYADRDTYRAWPGPNSNSYVDAMLRACGWRVALPGTAVGKDWRGWIGASVTARGTGVQVESPVAGVALGLTEGVEVHVLSLSVGVDWWPPAIVLPLGDGRLGFPDR